MNTVCKNASCPVCNNDDADKLEIQDTDREDILCLNCNQLYRLVENNRQDILNRNKTYSFTEAGIRARKKATHNYNRNHPLTILERVKNGRHCHPEKHRAQNAVAYAIKDGKLPQAKSRKCSICKVKQAMDYHHYLGYDKVHWLDVIPVCRKCHKILDKV